RMVAPPIFQVAQPSVPDGELSRPCEEKVEESLAGVSTGDCIHFPQERSEPVMVIFLSVKLLTVAITFKYSYLTFAQTEVSFCSAIISFSFQRSSFVANLPGRETPCPQPLQGNPRAAVPGSRK